MAKPRPKNRKPKYSGVLNEPMVFYAVSSMTAGLFKGLGLLGDASAKDQGDADQKNNAQLAERIKALYRHYEIDSTSPGADFALVLKLAFDHVPGFQHTDPFKRKRGAPKQWMGSKSLELYADVKALIRLKPGRSASEACRILATNKKYSARYGGKTHGNLLRRYHWVTQAGGYRGDFWMGDFIRKELAKGAPVDDWVIDAFAMPELRGKS